MSEKGQRLYELAEKVVERLKGDRRDYSVREVEDLIDKMCSSPKRIPLGEAGKTRPNPEFRLLRLLVREVAREKPCQMGANLRGPQAATV